MNDGGEKVESEKNGTNDGEGEGEKSIMVVKRW